MKVLITGANGSLGKELVRQAEAAGHTVCSVSKVDTEHGIGDSIADFPRCNAIINNHGFNFLQPIGARHYEEAQRIIDANVLVPYYAVSEAFRAGWTNVRVLNISSITHRVPQRCSAVYCASKAALVQMTRVQARELAPKGWVVNALCPGKIEDTEMSRLTDQQVLELRGGTAEEWEQYALKQIPMGRFTTCAEVADMAFHILEAPSYLNGAIIDFTGGM